MVQADCILCRRRLLFLILQELACLLLLVQDKKLLVKLVLLILLQIKLLDCLNALFVQFLFVSRSLLELLA